MPTKIKFELVVPDGTLLSIATTHQYSPTIEVDDNKGGKVTQPNPQSPEDFAIKFLENKWLLTLEHEMTYPVTQTKTPIEFSKLKEETLFALKANSSISI